MARRAAYIRGINRHRNYTVEAVARALAVTRVTIRRMLKAGLPAITDRRPYLIIGADLIDYLAGRKAQKVTLTLSQCYCFSCRAPREAYGRLADLVIQNTRIGNLQALCDTCSTPMNKAVSMAHLDALHALFDLTIRPGPSRITE